MKLCNIYILLPQEIRMGVVVCVKWSYLAWREILDNRSGIHHSEPVWHSQRNTYDAVLVGGTTDGPMIGWKLERTHYEPTVSKCCWLMLIHNSHTRIIALDDIYIHLYIYSYINTYESSGTERNDSKCETTTTTTIPLRLLNVTVRTCRSAGVWCWCWWWWWWWWWQ